MTDDEFIQATIKAREDAVHFFSSASKEEREKWVAQEFLDNLGVGFSPQELKVPASDPPDVNFRDIAFEIKEILDPDRRRHAEFKESLRRAKRATSVAELFEEVTPRDITFVEVNRLVVAQATQLSTKYAAAVREELDLLFYVNLEDVYGVIGDPEIDEEALYPTGWRSVSILMGSISCVAMAQSHAPTLLAGLRGKVVKRRRS